MANPFRGQSSIAAIPETTLVANPFRMDAQKPSVALKPPSAIDAIKTEVDRAASDMWAAVTQTGPSVVAELKTFGEIAKKAGIKTAAQAYVHQTRNQIGLPMSPEEEQDLFDSVALVRPELKGNPEGIRDFLYRGFHGGKEKAEWEKMARGLVDIGTFALPGGKIGQLAWRLPRNEILKRVAQLEAHSIASMVSWNVLQEYVKEEGEFGKAALEGVGIGAAIPPAFKGAGKLLSGAVKYGAKATGIVAKPTSKILDRAAMRLEAYRDIKEFAGHIWDYAGHAGEVLMDKAGASTTAARLRNFRRNYTLQGAQWYGNAWLALHGLSKREKSVVTDILHMSPEEVTNLIKTNPERYEPLVRRASVISNDLQEVAAQAEAWGVPIIDAQTKALRTFKPLNDFGMPHVIVNTEQYVTPGKIRDEALNILKLKHGKSQQEAEEILEAIHAHNTLEQTTGFKGYSQLRGRRWGLPGYIDDPDLVLQSYYHHMARRIESKRMFGAFNPTTGEPLTDWVGKPYTNLREIFPEAFREVDTIADPTRRELAERIISDQLGAWDTGGRTGKLATKVMQYQAIMKLGLSQITQATQFVASTIPTGMAGAFKDLIKLGARDPEAHYRLLRTGAFASNLMRKSYAEMMGGQVGAAQKYLKGTGFTLMDTGARQYGALRGFALANYAAEEYTRLANRLPKAGAIERKYISEKMDKIGKKLSNLFSVEDKARELSGGDPFAKQKFLDSVVANGGVIPDDMLSEAGLKLSTDVNFWSDSLSMPHFFRTPWGRVLFQFKSFGYQQAKFIDKYIVKPALDGDLGPLTRALTLNGVAGEAITDIKYALRGRERKDKGTERYIKNLSQAAMFGLVGDAIQSTEYGRAGVLGMLAGPTVTDAATVWEGAFQNRKQLGRLATTAAVSSARIGPVAIGPVLAPAATNILFPPKK